LVLVQDSQPMPLIPRGGNCALAFSAYIKVAEDVLEEKSIPSALLDACDVPAVCGGAPGGKAHAPAIMAPMCMQHCPQPQESPDQCPVVSPSAVATIADFHWGLHGMTKLIRDTQDGDIQQLCIGKAGTNLRRKRKT
jgi:hypothetical protein